MMTDSSSMPVDDAGGQGSRVTRSDRPAGVRFAVLFSLCFVAVVGCSRPDNPSNQESSCEVEGSIASDGNMDRDEKDPRCLVGRVVEAVGGTERLRQLRDVEFRYTYDLGGRKDISIERYVFDGELSWARYDTHDALVAPDMEGVLVQGWDGEEDWVTLNDTIVTDPREIRMGRFSRMTNLYWFAMFFKLLDPGLTYEYEGTRTVGALEYDLVRVGFEEGVGDVQDTYLLYINPYTHLVDRFLYTVMDFGITEPRLKFVHYRDVDRVKLPVYRSNIDANWDGDIVGDVWTQQITEEISFNNGFDRSLFENPSR